MRYRANIILLLLVAILFLGVYCGKAAPRRPAAAKAKASDGKSGVGDRNYRDAIGAALKNGRTVFLYMYSKRLPESLKELSIFERELQKSRFNPLLLKVDAEDNDAMHGAFAAEYAPTVYVMRPGAGIVGTFVVDVNAADVRKFATAKSDKLAPGQKEIAEGIRAGRPSYVFFMAQWCHFCARMRPEVERFKKTYGDRVNVVEIDTDQDFITADTYLVNGLPDSVALDKDGIPVERLAGSRSYGDIVDAFKDLVKKPAAPIEEAKGK